MEITKKIHQGYKSFIKAKANGLDIQNIFGKYQYVYENELGGISLVEFKNYFHKGDNFWEIYCFKGKLFEDVERFDTKKEAEKQIKKYLI